MQILRPHNRSAKSETLEVWGPKLLLAKEILISLICVKLWEPLTYILSVYVFMQLYISLNRAEPL